MSVSKPTLAPKDSFLDFYKAIYPIRKGAFIDLAYKATVRLKICGYLPQSLIRALRTGCEPLKVPSNQLISKSFCSTGHGVVAAVTIALGSF